MKLAYFSPLNPQPSGISDYSEELLPYLSAAGADITLFVDGFRPTNQQLLSHFPWHDYQKDSLAIDTLDGYDAVIYHMGNDHRYHSGIFDTMRRHPGVVVFHDFALQDFFLGLARQRNDRRLYLDELGECHGVAERTRAAEYLQHGSVPPHVSTPLDFPMNRQLARAAEGIITHSEWSRSRLELVAPGTPVAKINMGVDSRRVASPSTKSACDGQVSIASFGLLTPGKGVEMVLKTLSAIREEYDFKYVLVGGENHYFDVKSIIRSYNLNNLVSITGHVSLAEFNRRIAETDIALNIRERSVGETSASLCRIMAAGVASVVADVGWYAELPNDCTVKIPLDADSDKLLLAYLRRLIEDAPLRRRIGENAQRYILAEHRIERAAENYLQFIKETIHRRSQRKITAVVSSELLMLGVRESDEAFIRRIATDIGELFLERSSARPKSDNHDQSIHAASSGNGEVQPNHGTEPVSFESSIKTSGRLPKIAGVDYKRAAIEYLGKLSEERRHHLRTKPFYNLAHKPAKYKREGMEEDMHRHFCDFANMAMELALPPGSRILDVGCGSGWLSEYFARLGYCVTGIDISPDLIEMSRERVARVPYGVDHVTQLVCVFKVHDIEVAPLSEKFDAILCYDSLHHFEDEQAVMRHLAAMLPIGGQLFVLEGERPSAGSLSEEELHGVMRQFKTLESPFEFQYLRKLLDEHGFAIVGDYISVNGLFEREILEGDYLPLKKLPTNHNYLICKKVSEYGASSTVPDSRRPGVLAVRFSLPEPVPNRVAAGSTLTVPLAMENTGDTLWLTGQSVRAGIVMPAVRILDDNGTLVDEFHGEPLLPRAVAPGETVKIKIEYAAPRRPGAYTMKIDLVDQHVCWFEQQGSKPLVLHFDIF